MDMEVTNFGVRSLGGPFDIRDQLRVLEQWATDVPPSASRTRPASSIPRAGSQPQPSIQSGKSSSSKPPLSMTTPRSSSVAAGAGTPRSNARFEVRNSSTPRGSAPDSDIGVQRSDSGMQGISIALGNNSSSSSSPPSPRQRYLSAASQVSSGDGAARSSDSFSVPPLAISSMLSNNGGYSSSSYDDSSLSYPSSSNPPTRPLSAPVHVPHPPSHAPPPHSTRSASSASSSLPARKLFSRKVSIPPSKPHNSNNNHSKDESLDPYMMAAAANAGISPSDLNNNNQQLEEALMRANQLAMQFAAYERPLADLFAPPFAAGAGLDQQPIGAWNAAPVVTTKKKKQQQVVQEDYYLNNDDDLSDFVSAVNNFSIDTLAMKQVPVSPAMTPSSPSSASALQRYPSYMSLHSAGAASPSPAPVVVQPSFSVSLEKRHNNGEKKLAKKSSDKSPPVKASPRTKHAAPNIPPQRTPRYEHVLESRPNSSSSSSLAANVNPSTVKTLTVMEHELLLVDHTRALTRIFQEKLKQHQTMLVSECQKALTARIAQIHASLAEGEHDALRKLEVMKASNDALKASHTAQLKSLEADRERERNRYKLDVERLKKRVLELEKRITVSEGAVSARHSPPQQPVFITSVVESNKNSSAEIGIQVEVDDIDMYYYPNSDEDEEEIATPAVNVIQKPKIVPMLPLSNLAASAVTPRYGIGNDPKSQAANTQRGSARQPIDVAAPVAPPPESGRQYSSRNPRSSRPNTAVMVSSRSHSSSGSSSARRPASASVGSTKDIFRVPAEFDFFH